MNIFLNEYLSVLKLEKNLSENTIESYRSDISSLLRFLEEYKIDDPSEVGYENLIAFFKALKNAGLNSRSAARYYSSLKGFFNYLVRNKYIAANPIEKVPTPKLGKNLPSVLSVNEVDAILSKPDTANILGLRDKAMLETFYACGIRVSELINLKLSDIFLEEEVIRVLGKGSKERLVPIGSSAIEWINNYLKHSRLLLEKKTKSGNFLFLNNHELNPTSIEI